MNLLARILSCTTIVHAEFTSEGVLCTSVHLVRGEHISDSDWEAAAKSIVLVLVGGHGVVTKPNDSQIAARVCADNDTFLRSESEGRISFLRREQLRGLDEELVAHKVTPVQIFCIRADADFEVAAIACVQQFWETLQWKGLIRITDADSAVAQALVRRIALPVLGVFLLLLSGNMLLLSRLNARRQWLQTELAGREQAWSKTASVNDVQLRIIREFGERPVVSRAVVCDRIARAVPGGVQLTRLEIEPLAKRFEAGKPLEWRAGMAVVCGTALMAADISQYVEQLSATACCQKVQLANVEKERETDRLSFLIEIKL